MASDGYWQRRNEKARDLGYRNYYDYRVHGYGRTPPAAPAATGERLRRLRGHAGPADMRRASGRAVLAIVEPDGPRDKQGRFSRARVVLTMDDGSDQEFYLSQSQMRLRGEQIVDDLRAAGATVLDAYGLLTGEPTVAEYGEEAA